MECSYLQAVTCYFTCKLWEAFLPDIACSMFSLSPKHLSSSYRHPSFLPVTYTALIFSVWLDAKQIEVRNSTDLTSFIPTQVGQRNEQYTLAEWTYSIELDKSEINIVNEKAT